MKKLTKWTSSWRYFEPEVMSTEDIILHETLQWLISPRRHLMLTGQAYYENRNDINHRQRLVVGSDGLQADNNLANCRISHAFAKKLVDQKCQYLLGLPLSVRCSDDDYTAALNRIFDRAMLKRLANICKESINKGIAWLQVYIDDGGKLGFMKIPSEQVIPLWQDDEKQHLEALIRVYEQSEYLGHEEQTVLKLEYWHPDGVDCYRLEKSKNFKPGKSRRSEHKYRLLPDDERRQMYKEQGWDFGGSLPHFVCKGEPVCWPELPFIPFRYNEEELPLIQFIKPLIDDYDLLSSEDSNSIIDSPNSILVIKNYDGTDLGEFRRNLAAYRAVKVSDEGGLDALQQSVNTDYIAKHLSEIRKDLFEIGGGVDTQTSHTGNTSGEYLKYLYADLDLDCNGIEREFQSGLAVLLRLINYYWLISGQPCFEHEKAEFIFNRDILINESEAISNCVQSLQVLSKETVLANHPWVRDLVTEQAILQREAADQQQSEEAETEV